jgi:hypothetical protein
MCVTSDPCHRIFCGLTVTYHQHTGGTGSIAPNSAALPDPVVVCPSRSSAPTRAVTRLQNIIIKSNKCYDGFIRYANMCVIGDPESVEEAFDDPNWKAAMQEEYDALQRNNTWHLVPSREGKNIIDCKWYIR